MKKLRLLLFTLFIGLLFNMCVSAASYKFTCEYETTSYPNDKYSLTLKTNGDQTDLSACENEISYTDYIFDTNGNSFEYLDDRCPSSFDYNYTDKTIVWKKDYQGNYKYVEGSKVFNLYTKTIWDKDVNYNSMTHDKRVEVFNGIIQHNKRVLGDKTAEQLVSDDKFWASIFNSKQYTCEYKSSNETYKLTFVNTTLDKLLLLKFSEIKDCSSFTFDANGNYSKNSNSCPSSIDISGETITWVKDEKGEYKYTGERTDSESTGEKTPCYNFDNETNCKNSKDYACVWTENKNAPNGKGFCNVDNLLYVGCGGASDIPVQVPALISFAVNLLKIATPIILIFISIISLLKALSAQKEDEIKKAQSSLVKKIIAAALVFFVVSIVQFVVSKVGTEKEVGGFSNCLKCFLNNDCKLTTYYKTNVSGEDYCTSFGTGETKLCDDLFEESFEE